MLLIRDLRVFLIFLPPVLTHSAKGWYLKSRLDTHSSLIGLKLKFSSALEYSNSSLSSPLSSFPTLTTITTAPSAQPALNKSTDRCQHSWDSWRLSSRSFDLKVSSKKLLENIQPLERPIRPCGQILNSHRYGTLEMMDSIT